MFTIGQLALQHISISPVEAPDGCVLLGYQLVLNRLGASPFANYRDTPVNAVLDLPALLVQRIEVHAVAVTRSDPDEYKRCFISLGEVAGWSKWR